MTSTPNFKRKTMLGISQLLIAVALSLGFASTKEWGTYDVIKAIFVVLALIYGVWCFVKPFASLEGNILTVNKTPFTTLKIDLQLLSKVGIEKRRLAVEQEGKAKLFLTTGELTDEEGKRFIGLLKSHCKPIDQN